MSAGKVVISVRDVTVSYPVKQGFMKWSRYTPIKNISFDLHRGETVGIVGKNGAGKSSLLRMIAGIIEPDRGQIVNHGVRVSLLALGVGFVPHLTGRENVMLSGMLMGLKRGDVAQRMEAVIEFSGLGAFIDQPLRTYSSGMQARLGFSTAIQVDPDVVLIDEVLGVGDEDFRIKSTAELKRMINSEKAVVLVSHNVPAIKELCQRVLWVDGGSMKMDSDVSSVMKEYTNRK